MTTRRSQDRAAALAAAALSLLAAAPPPEPANLPQVRSWLRFESGRLPTRQTNSGFQNRGETWLRGGTALDGRGYRVGRGAIAYPEYLCLGRDLGVLVVTYPDLGQGHIVPVFGHLYRCRGAGGTYPHSAVELDLLPPSRWPVGVTMRRDSLVVPLAADGRGGLSIHSEYFQVVSIGAASGRQQSAWLRFSMYAHVNGKHVAAEATVRPGDVLWVKKAGHRVRAVVPADAKTRVIGWVELSPDPIPEAELGREKARVVRPAPAAE